eukprot:TRINITY_DN4916_c0_g1_i1.p1 TRINITY_DN4916_c0_g1~~TRINITY_DN4916_c0_g1_i1.p1  ORF type:complete len:373 (+),score=129.33 TRINITY_DN4916_c0_g1_i1:198-1316(+)
MATACMVPMTELQQPHLVQPCGLQVQCGTGVAEIQPAASVSDVNDAGQIKTKGTDVCRHWARGFCNRGLSCGFAHTGPSPSPSGEPRNTGADAEQIAYNKSHVSCKDFASGKCNRGERCKFAHVGTGPKRGIPSCRDWAAGTCNRGDTCKYKHDKTPAQALQPAVTNRTSSSSTLQSIGNSSISSNPLQPLQMVRAPSSASIATTTSNGLSVDSHLLNNSFRQQGMVELVYSQPTTPTDTMWIADQCQPMQQQVQVVDPQRGWVQVQPHAVMHVQQPVMQMQPVIQQMPMQLIQQMPMQAMPAPVGPEYQSVPFITQMAQPQPQAQQIQQAPVPQVLPPAPVPVVEATLGSRVEKPCRLTPEALSPSPIHTV